MKIELHPSEKQVKLVILAILVLLGLTYDELLLLVGL